MSHQLSLRKRMALLVVVLSISPCAQRAWMLLALTAPPIAASSFCASRRQALVRRLSTVAHLMLGVAVLHWLSQRSLETALVTPLRIAVAACWSALLFPSADVLAVSVLHARRNQAGPIQLLGMMMTFARQLGPTVSDVWSAASLRGARHSVRAATSMGTRLPGIVLTRALDRVDALATAAELRGARLAPGTTPARSPTCLEGAR